MVAISVQRFEQRAAATVERLDRVAPAGSGAS
jgi:hypothetical protein